ncbi:MAG TPA: hypothetical protein VF954_04815 [Acidimicrobiales bacterium]
MPWCEGCDRFYNPTSLGKVGECPTCGRVLAKPPSPAAPWHFKLMIVAVSVYLAYRLVQGVVWIAHHA